MSTVNENYEEQTPVTPEELLGNENELLQALTDKDPHSDITETIEVNLMNKTRFRFRIRPLEEKEWDKCRERATKYTKVKRFGGMRMPESTDTTVYHSALIYTATLDEDRARLWDNKRLWAAANALTGIDMVDKLIPLAGKKQAIVDRIEALSGYGEEEEELGETIKN